GPAAPGGLRGGARRGLACRPLLVRLARRERPPSVRRTTSPDADRPSVTDAGRGPSLPHLRMGLGRGGCHGPPSLFSWSRTWALPRMVPGPLAIDEIHHGEHPPGIVRFQEAPHDWQLRRGPADAAHRAGGRAVRLRPRGSRRWDGSGGWRGKEGRLVPHLLAV